VLFEKFAALPAKVGEGAAVRSEIAAPERFGRGAQAAQDRKPSSPATAATRSSPNTARKSAWSGLRKSRLEGA
jgi:hypothetical protein